MKSFHGIKVLFSGKRFLRLFLYTKEGKKRYLNNFLGTQNGSFNDITCENLLLEPLEMKNIHKLCSRIRDFQCGLQHLDCMLFLWLVCCCFARCTSNDTNLILVCMSQSLHSLSIITSHHQGILSLHILIYVKDCDPLPQPVFACSLWPLATCAICS